MLSGKTAVITGASRGIGRATAEKFAQAGAKVAVIYKGNDENAKMLRSKYENISVYKCDVSDFDDCSNTVKKILDDFKSVDILVNNAGITKDGLILTMSENDFNDVINVNLNGTFNMIKCLCRNFVKNKHGKIINISSVSGITGNAGQANYSASKAGIIGLTKTVAKELAAKNVCCNAIAPGFVDTDMTADFVNDEKIINAIPLKRAGKPQEVAELAAFLASDAANYITGEIIRIDGGLAI